MEFSELLELPSNLGAESGQSKTEFKGKSYQLEELSKFIQVKCDARTCLRCGNSTGFSSTSTQPASKASSRILW